MAILAPKSSPNVAVRIFHFHLQKARKEPTKQKPDLLLQSKSLKHEPLQEAPQAVPHPAAQVPCPSVGQYPLPAAATHPSFKSFLLFSYRWLQGACLSPSRSVSCGLFCPLLTAQGPPIHVVQRKVHSMAELTQQPVPALCSLQKRLRFSTLLHSVSPRSFTWLWLLIWRIIK